MEIILEPQSSTGLIKKSLLRLDFIMTIPEELISRKIGVISKQLDELPPELTQEVLDFIEFLRIRRAKKGVSEQNFLFIQQENLRKIWDSENENLYEI